MKRPILRDFWARCREFGEHRIWKDTKNFRFTAKQVSPVTWIYEYHNGPVPEGMRPVMACGVTACMAHVVLAVERGRVAVDDSTKFSGGFALFEVTEFGKISAGKCRTREKAIASARKLARLTPTGGVAVYQNDPMNGTPWPVGFYAAGLMGVQAIGNTREQRTLFVGA